MNKEITTNKTRQRLEANMSRFTDIGLTKGRENAFLKLAEIDFRERLLPSLGKLSAEQIGVKLEEYIKLLVVMARLDLMPDITNNKAYIIQRKGALVLQIGYKAYLEFASRSGWLFNTQVIYEKDEFDIDLATTIIKHKPSFVDRSDTSIVGVYCVATKGSERVVEFMSKEEIDFVKKEASTKIIWDKWYGEMAKKTIIKRIIKRIDISGTKLALADAVDNSLGYDNSKNPTLVNQVMEAMPEAIDINKGAVLESVQENIMEKEDDRS